MRAPHGGWPFLSESPSAQGGGPQQFRPGGARSCTYKWAARPAPARGGLCPRPTLPRPALADLKVLANLPHMPRSPASGDYPPATDRRRPPPANMSGSPAVPSRRAGGPTRASRRFLAPVRACAAERRSRPRGGRSTRPSLSQDTSGIRADGGRGISWVAKTMLGW
jgi:hypothetical protein